MDKTHYAKEIRTAIKSGQLETLKDLFEKEPEMLIWMTPFGTWLHVAVAHGNLEIVKYLVNNGIDINIKGRTFSTNALERAAAKGYLEIAKYLISQNVEIDTSEPDRNPLFAAIHGGHLDIVRYLVKIGIDITIKYTGESMKDMDAYAFAVERGQTEIAEYLKQKIAEQE